MSDYDDIEDDLYGVGIVTLPEPDGRKVQIAIYGSVEWDTNAFNETRDPVLTWLDTGEELSADEMDAVIYHDGTKSYLHEYVQEHAFK